MRSRIPVIERLETRRFFSTSVGLAPVSPSTAADPVVAMNAIGVGAPPSDSVTISSAATPDGGSVRLEWGTDPNRNVLYQLHKVAANGRTDTRFGTEGFVSLSSPRSFVVDPSAGDSTGVITEYAKVLVDASGNIFVTGEQFANFPNGGPADRASTPLYASNALIVSRFAADGSPDDAYGANGTAALSLGSGSTDVTVVSAQGKVTFLISSSDASGNSIYEITQLDASGQPDASFGTSGVVPLPVTNTHIVDPTSGSETTVSTYYTQLAVTPSGNVLAFADEATSSSTPSAANGGPDTYAASQSFIILDFSATGARNDSFGESGTLSVALSGSVAIPTALVTAEGKIDLFVASSRAGADASFRIMQFDASGQPEINFGDGGTADVAVVQPDGGSAWTTQFIAQRDGTFLVGGIAVAPGISGERGFITKLNADGSVDFSYGTAGTAAFDVSGPSAGIPSYSVESNGEVTATVISGNHTANVARLTVSGQPDPTFITDLIDQPIAYPINVEFGKPPASQSNLLVSSSPGGDRGGPAVTPASKPFKSPTAATSFSSAAILVRPMSLAISASGTTPPAGLFADATPVWQDEANTVDFLALATTRFSGGATR